MKINFFKTISFYAGVILFLLLICLTLGSLNVSILWKVLIIIGGVLLYIGKEIGQSVEIARNLKKEQAEKLLSTVDNINSLMNGQRLRSNIFCLNRKKDKYCIRYSYNMNGYNDKNILIPVNMGCTGEAWRDRRQVWGKRDKIFKSGDFRIPAEELNKVPEDIQWICSTPIVDNNGEMIAVMNFDGNREMSQTEEELIKKHCEKICEELKEIFSR